jgi:hypothetical protein
LLTLRPKRHPLLYPPLPPVPPQCTKGPHSPPRCRRPPLQQSTGTKCPPRPPPALPRPPPREAEARNPPLPAPPHQGHNCRRPHSPLGSSSCHAMKSLAEALVPGVLSLLLLFLLLHVLPLLLSPGAPAGRRRMHLPRLEQPERLPPPRHPLAQRLALGRSLWRMRPSQLLQLRTPSPALVEEAVRAPFHHPPHPKIQHQPLLVVVVVMPCHLPMRQRPQTQEQVQ